MNAVALLLIVLVVEVTGVFALALLAVRLASGARAAVRHLILASAFGVVLVLPLVALVSPRIAFELSALPASAADPLAALPVVAGPIQAESPLTVSSPADRAATSAAPARSIPTATWLLLIWEFVALLALAPVIASLLHLRRIRRSGTPWLEGATHMNELARAAGMRPPVLLLHEVAGPITSGILRPVIALPAGAVTWSAAHIANALVHELAHVRRRDWLVHLTSRAVCALYWFHPLVWVAWRKLRLEAERACDDAVLARADAATYAEQLLELARHLSHQPAPGLSMASSSDLSTRITSVLDNKRPRGRASKIVIACTVLVAVGAVAALAPLRATATGEKRMVRAAELLAQRSDADSLAAAGLLIAFQRREEGLRLVARASLLAPQRADLVWLHIQLCEAVADCDTEPMENRLRTLDAQNGAGWLGALARASKHGDEAAKSAALAAIARSERVDIYWTTLIARLSPPIASTKAVSLYEAQIDVIGALAAVAIPALRHMTDACKSDRMEQSDVVEVCRGVANSLMNGDTAIMESIGTSLAKQVWPENSAKRVEVAEAKRILDYRMRSVGLSDAWLNAHASDYLDLLKQHRREQDLFKAVLIAAGKNPDPAPAE
jgi:beta-lactamase regulating signal transducer with metallopeptidase domain